MNKKYLEIQKLIRENRSDSRIAEVLSNYHENDIAELLENLSRTLRVIHSPVVMLQGNAHRLCDGIQLKTV